MFINRALVKVVAEAGINSSTKSNQQKHNQISQMQQHEVRKSNHNVDPPPMNSVGRRLTTASIKPLRESSADEFDRWVPSMPAKSHENEISFKKMSNQRTSIMSSRSSLMSPVVERCRRINFDEASIEDGNKTPIRGSSSRGAFFSQAASNADDFEDDGTHSNYVTKNQSKKKNSFFGKKKLFGKRSKSIEQDNQKKSSVEGQESISQDSVELTESGTKTLSSLDFASMIDSSRSITSEAIKFEIEMNFPRFVEDKDKVLVNTDKKVKLLWRKILARCKHETMADVMTGGTISNGSTANYQNSVVKQNLKKTASHVFHRLKYDGEFVGMNTLMSRRNFETRKEADDDLPKLSFLTMDLGSTPLCLEKESKQDQNMRFVRIHQWESKLVHSVLETSTLKDLMIVDLINAARTSYAMFGALIKSTAQYVLKNYIDIDVESSYSVDIKSAESIKRKADFKYGGEMLRVKDILRGFLILPDEDSLLNSIICIKQNCAESNGEMEIVRFKNLFKMNVHGALVPTDLPTGYRHIICNIRMKSGIVAGKSRYFSTLTSTRI